MELKVKNLLNLLKDINYREWRIIANLIEREYVRVANKNMNGFDCYIFYKRTSELSTREFWQLLKGLENECREAGIETLEDKEFREMMERYDSEAK